MEGLDTSTPDFFEIKESLKSTLKSNTRFKDYNFEGSNLSLLLDVLAYNTHYLILYNNLVSNELFLDSSIKRSSAVSRAKELNYIPRGFSASTAFLTLTVSRTTAPPEQRLVLPRWTVFKTTNTSGKVFSFLSVNGHSTPWIQEGASLWVARFGQIEVKEGRKLTYTYQVDSSPTDQTEYVIPQENVDMSTLVVTVQKSRTDFSQEVYEPYRDITQIRGDSRVYFFQENVSGRFQIYFGDNILGKKPVPTNLVILDYIITNGEEANGATSFKIMAPPEWTSSGIKVESVSLLDPVFGASSGGSGKEPLERIKWVAPKIYEAQGRAVTANDYAVKVISEFPNVEAIRVWGGEEENPPIFGKVFIAVKPKQGRFLSSIDKTRIEKKVLEDYRVVTIKPVVVDPDYLFISLEAMVNWDSSKTFFSEDEIENIVLDTINQKLASMGSFDSEFVHSEMVAAIDDSNTSIKNTLLSVRMGKEITVKTGKVSAKIDFKNAIDDNLKRGAVTSSVFMFNGRTPAIISDSHGDSSLNVVSAESNGTVLQSSIGKVDYKSGVVTLTNWLVTEAGKVQIYAVPKKLNVKGSRGQIIVPGTVKVIINQDQM